MITRGLLSVALFCFSATLTFAQAPPGTRREAPTTTAASRGHWHAEGTRGAVTAGGQEAVAIGLAMLEAGGNAADAAVATILAQSVTDSDMFCFGGEVPLLVYDAAKKQVTVVAGQGAAPKLATRELLAGSGIPGSGLRAATVPAVLDACLTMLDRYGTRTFAEAATPTLGLLDRHRKVWHAQLAATLRRLIAAEQAAGSDRHAGLAAVADYFYRGPLAAEIDQWCATHDGLLRATDLAAHKTPVEAPVSIDYRFYTVYKCGPWTQGPWLLEALALLEGFDLARMGAGSPDAIHAMTEAMKLALADRDVFYGDPEFVDVPIAALLAPRYAELRRPLIDLKHASLVQRPGDPRGGKPLLDRAQALKGLGNPDHDTTTCLVADSAGNVVAATPSGWSGALVGDTGIWLSSRLQSFNTWPGHPNCLAPGKRPRITLSPTLVTHGGKPALAVSVAGGDGQDQAALQLLVDAIDFGLTPQQAVTAVRFGTNHFVGSFGQTPPELGSLQIYTKAGAPTIADLKARGHIIKTRVPPMWNPSMLAIDPATGRIEAAGDPQAGRHSAAY